MIEKKLTKAQEPYGYQIKVFFCRITMHSLFLILGSCRRSK